MPYLKGIVTAIRQCGGCVEVTVSGRRSGSFPIDNCFVPALLDPDGPGLLGRLVEYRDGCFRILDDSEALAETTHSTVTPLPLPSGSSDHI